MSGGLADVRGRCPACGAESLHIEVGAGMVHCLAPGCPSPGAAGQVLNLTRGQRGEGDVVYRMIDALDSYRRARLADEALGEPVNQANMAGDVLADVLVELAAEVERLRSYRSLPVDMVWRDYCSPDEVLRIRRPLDDEVDRLQRALVAKDQAHREEVRQLQQEVMRERELRAAGVRR